MRAHGDGLELALRRSAFPRSATRGQARPRCAARTRSVQDRRCRRGAGVVPDVATHRCDSRVCAGRSTRCCVRGIHGNAVRVREHTEHARKVMAGTGTYVENNGRATAVDRARLGNKRSRKRTEVACLLDRCTRRDHCTVVTGGRPPHRHPQGHVALPRDIKPVAMHTDQRAGCGREALRTNRTLQPLSDIRQRRPNNRRHKRSSRQGSRRRPDRPPAATGSPCRLEVGVRWHARRRLPLARSNTAVHAPLGLDGKRLRGGQYSRRLSRATRWKWSRRSSS